MSDERPEDWKPIKVHPSWTRSPDGSTYSTSPQEIDPDQAFDVAVANDIAAAVAAPSPSIPPEPVTPSDKDATDGTDGRPDPVRTRSEGPGDGAAEGTGSAADAVGPVVEPEADQEVAEPPVYGIGTAAHLREWIAAPDLGLRYSAHDFKRTVAALLDALDPAAPSPDRLRERVEELATEWETTVADAEPIDRFGVGAVAATSRHARRLREALAAASGSGEGQR